MRSRILDNTALVDPVNLFYVSPEEALDRTFDRHRNKSIDGGYKRKNGK